MDKVKQQVIQDAYGEYWNLLKDLVDENGWIQSKGEYHFIEWEDIFQIDEYPLWGYSGEVINCEKWRPKALYGIENNNGWIKIESKEDYPKENCDCWVMNKNGEIRYEYYYFGLGGFIKTATYSLRDPNEKLTHYQPIIKPLKPIY